MSPDRGQDDVKDAERSMARDGEEMEEELGQLDEHLAEAKRAAANPPIEPDEGVTGDWEGEATGSQQGEDPSDTKRPGSGEGKDPNQP